MLEKYIYQPERSNIDEEKEIKKKEKAEVRKKLVDYYLEQLEITDNDPVKAFNYTLKFFHRNSEIYDVCPLSLRGILVYEGVYKPFPKPPLMPVFNVGRFAKDVLPHNIYENTVKYLPIIALLELCKLFIDNEAVAELDKIIETHKLLW